MEINRINLVFFSPTGTTLKVLEGVAQGIAVADVRRINLTLPPSSEETVTTFGTDELVIIGAPVYGGRLPADALKRFQGLRGDTTPAIIIVVYGNREFEDALLELKNLSIDLGLVPIAAGAFIGEHSFATRDKPIANGRPDSQDITEAKEFGSRVQRKVEKLSQPSAQILVEVPGRFPYQGGVRLLAVAPVTNEDSCSLCGTCATVCPTTAIDVNDQVTTKVALCIRCCACIKNCPENARVIDDQTWLEITNWLHEKCADRKEPQVFGVDR